MSSGEKGHDQGHAQTLSPVHVLLNGFPSSMPYKGFHYLVTRMYEGCKGKPGLCCRELKEMAQTGWQKVKVIYIYILYTLQFRLFYPTIVN